VILDANDLPAHGGRRPGTGTDSHKGQRSGDSEHAELRVELKVRGRPIPGTDVWIAALARQHAMPVISRDEHFDFVPRLKRVAW
jgi:hypothetical protein